ncbi:MAG: RNA polymerase sigma factor [Planctomycetota bacterium]|jgi:RNA polymerase sigma-70 factor (ECF subfamily)
MMNRQDPVPDEALIEAVHRGDRDAAAWLYNRHVDRVHRICCRIVLDPSQVQDCVQEVWLKVFRKLDRFRGDRPFAAWLNSVAANTAIDHYRKWIRHNSRVKNHEIHTRAAAKHEDLTERQLDGALVQQRVSQALEAVSVNQRTAFVLRYYEEMPVAEIAETLGCTEGAVRTHVRRSLIALRARLTGKIDV